MASFHELKGIIMKINNIDLKVTEHPTIGEHFILEVKNTHNKQFIVIDAENESVKIRLSLDTVLKMAQFIDEYFDEVIKTKMEIGV
jgi:hypothetical protein